MPERTQAILSRMHALDTTLCVRASRSSRHRWVRMPFRLVSRLGDGVFWYALMSGLMLADPAGAWPACLHMLATGSCGILLYKLIKARTLRPRPYQVHREVCLTGVPLDHYSFPSGHTLHAVAFSAVALAYYPELAWLLLPFTLLVGLSRVVLGLHYPSDVLAGALLGATIAGLSLMLVPA